MKKGYELYEMIAKGKIRKNTKFIDARNKVWKFDGAEFIKEIGDSDIYSDLEFATMDFKIIEDEEEPKMFEQEWFNSNEGTMSIVEVDLAVKINELIKAVKQLDEKVNSIEQK